MSDDKLIKPIIRDNTDDSSSSFAERSKYNDRLLEFKRSRFKIKDDSEIDNGVEKVKESKSEEIKSVIIENKIDEKVDTDVKVIGISQPRRKLKAGIVKEEVVSKKDEILVEEKKISTDKPRKEEEKKEIPQERTFQDIKRVGVARQNTNVKKEPVKRNKSKCIGIIKRKDVSKLTESEKEKRMQELSEKIIYNINKRLADDIRELNKIREEKNKLIEDFENEQDLEKWQERQKKLEELKQRIQDLIDQIMLLHDNYNFENVLEMHELEDQNLVNDIIEYRDILDTTEHSEKLTEEYKLLDNYVLLYREIFLTEDRTKDMVEKTDDKVTKLEKRDKDYKKLQEDIEDVKEVEDQCKRVIKKQNQYLEVLMRRISQIDSSRIVDYKFKGANEILTSTLMFIAIMGGSLFIPGVRGTMVRTNATRKMMKNLREATEFEKIEKTVYEASDFENEIFAHLGEVDMALHLIDDTLEEISRYRDKFNKEFKNVVNGFEEVETKLNEIEKSIVDAKKQTLALDAKLRESEKINAKKLVKVKELNSAA